MALMDILPGHAGPATHALVIGVGAYRHLLGGPDPSPNAATWNLGQLPGAATSANRIADWLKTRFRNTSAPLATIEHLVTGPEGAALGSQEPTMAAVQTAFGAWHARASADPGNIALFYFAGHGALKGTETALLLADFLDPTVATLSSRAVHFEGTLAGMFSCKADRQCFIVDACRTQEAPLLGAMSKLGIALAEADESNVRPVPQPILFATDMGQAAFQVMGAASPLVEALIASLEGMGADDPTGGWSPGQVEVNTNSLFVATKVAMDLARLYQPFMPPQRAEPAGHGMFTLHYPEGPIKIPLLVGCMPRDLNLAATLAVQADGVEVGNQAFLAPDLRLDLVPGLYDVEAQLGRNHPTQAGFVARCRIMLTPPFKAPPLRTFAPPPPTPPLPPPRPDGIS